MCANPAGIHHDARAHSVWALCRGCTQADKKTPGRRGRSGSKDDGKKIGKYGGQGKKGKSGEDGGGKQRKSGSATGGKKQEDTGGHHFANSALVRTRRGHPGDDSVRAK